MAVRSFSGAVKVADVSDFVAPAQECVVALGVEAKEEKNEGQVSLQRKTKVARGQQFSQVRLAKKAKGEEKESSLKVTLNDCLACSGCVTSAETVLLEQQSAEEFLRVLEENARDRDGTTRQGPKVIVVTLSSQSRTSLAAHYGLSPLETTMKIAGFLRTLGVDYVLEDNLGRDVALLATLEEFWDNYTNKSKEGSSLPLLTSECPGWVLYAEKTHGSLVLPHMSKTRSAIATQGSLAKKLLPEKLGIEAGSIYHCFISPCFDKKLEASREDLKSGEFSDLDCVLATVEFHDLLRTKGFDAQGAPLEPFDDLLGGQGTREVQFSTMGSSGGYLEFVFRESAARLNGTIDFSPEKPLPLKVVRNQDFQEITLSGANGEVLLHFALAYGFRNIQNVIRRIKQKKMTYHFVEIMACPSGCLNGGGQMKEDQEAGGPRVIDRKEILSQLERLYHHDQVEMRGPKSNPSASQIGDWLGGFRSARALDALGAKFHDRSQKKTEQSAINLDF